MWNCPLFATTVTNYYLIGADGFSCTFDELLGGKNLPYTVKRKHPYCYVSEDWDTPIQDDIEDDATFTVDELIEQEPPHLYYVTSADDDLNVHHYPYATRKEALAGAKELCYGTGVKTYVVTDCIECNTIIELTHLDLGNLKNA